MFKEKRKFPRFLFNEPVKIIIDGKVYTKVVTKDISKNGMCLFFKERPPMNNSGKIKLSAKLKKEPVDFEASFKKIWEKHIDSKAHETYMGILFSPVDKKSIIALEKILSTYQNN